MLLSLNKVRRKLWLHCNYEYLCLNSLVYNILLTNNLFLPTSGTLPALTNEGKIFLETKSKVSHYLNLIELSFVLLELTGSVFRLLARCGTRWQRWYLRCPS